MILLPPSSIWSSFVYWAPADSSYFSHPFSVSLSLWEPLQPSRPSILGRNEALNSHGLSLIPSLSPFGDIVLCLLTASATSHPPSQVLRPRAHPISNLNHPRVRRVGFIHLPDPHAFCTKEYVVTFLDSRPQVCAVS